MTQQVSIGPDPVEVAQALKSRSLLEPPDWLVGEWWKVQVTTFWGGKFEATRVVAAVEGDDYLVGMPERDWVNALLLLHVPGVGEVSRFDLSFEQHDVRFEPLRFPLERGATWSTAFEGRPVTAKVLSASGARAEIDLNGTDDHMVLTYDAEVGEVVKFVHDTYAQYEVVAHGTGYRDIITVPRGQDLVFLKFRLGGVLGPGLQPAPPIDTVTVSPDYDRISLALLLGTTLPDTNSPQAVYREIVHDPSGGTYDELVSPLHGPGLFVFTYMKNKPGGTWTFDHYALGPGIAGAEGIAYKIQNVQSATGQFVT